MIQGAWSCRSVGPPCRCCGARWSTSGCVIGPTCSCFRIGPYCACGHCPDHCQCVITDEARDYWWPYSEAWRQGPTVTLWRLDTLVDLIGFVPPEMPPNGGDLIHYTLPRRLTP